MTSRRDSDSAQAADLFPNVLRASCISRAKSVCLDFDRAAPQMNGDWQNIFHKRAKMFTARRFDRAGQIEAPTTTASAGRPPALSRFSIRLAFASNRSD